jgi:uncharacterized protein
METVEGNLLTFVLIGALAQLIDGSLGMGYKTSTTTFLLSLGVPPVLASSGVHIAGIATSAVSGYSHYRFGNLDKSLFWKLVLPGIVGAVIGAVLLTRLPGDVIKPVIAIYLLLLGVRIVLKSLQRRYEPSINLHITPLGMAGGFFDAIGGGGWGPIVTSTLMMNGHDPRKTIGSVNITEFFVTLFQSVVFIFLLDVIAWELVVGLMIGGVATAPFAAYVTQLLPVRRLMLFVGIMVCVLSLRTLFSVVM